MRLRIFPGGRAALLLIVTLVAAPWPSAMAQAEEPRGIARFFRFGSRRDHEPAHRAEPPQANQEHENAPAGPPTSAPSPFGVVPPSSTGRGSPSPYRDGGGNPYGSSPSTLGSYNPLLNARAGDSAASPAVTAFTGPSTANTPESATAGPRLVPQPRVNRPVTEAEPILTRISIGRSDDGQRFGMFLQVFADGTVLDSEGVHHVGPDALRPLVEALRSADVGRIKGHCGGPPTDFVEQVHLTVYDQSRGRLQANHFSYSGNPAGCDPAIRVLQEAIDAFQARLLGVPPSAAAEATTAETGASVPAPLGSPTSPAATSQPISLTPVGGSSR